MPCQTAEALIEHGLKILPDEAFALIPNTNEVLIADESSPLILLIEDHHELREFIRQSLFGKYRLITAADGEESIALGLQHTPNLVITDLMDAQGKRIRGE